MDWHRFRSFQKKTKIILIILVFDAQCPFANMIYSMIQRSILERANKRTVAEMRRNERRH